MPSLDTLSDHPHARRFVILEHTGSASYKPGVHWDLLCEEGDFLRAWELAQPLTVGQQTALALPVHRRAYLEYEGPISGDRGTVRRIAAGTYELLGKSATEWAFRLTGDSLAGEVRLRRSTPEESSWQLSFAPLGKGPTTVTTPS